jgi:hypothetical protein
MGDCVNHAYMAQLISFTHATCQILKHYFRGFVIRKHTPKNQANFIHRIAFTIANKTQKEAYEKVHFEQTATMGICHTKYLPYHPQYV